MTTRRPLLTALAAALAVPLGVAGCASGSTDAEITRALESAIVAAVPHSTGVFVGLGYSGASNRTVVVNLYLDSDDTSIVSAAVDSGLKTVWAAIAVEPVSVGISATAGQKPHDAERYEPNALDPRPVASALGIDPKHVIHHLIDLDAATLVARYGAWQAPAS